MFYNNWAKEVNGCLHGQRNQMAITLFHTSTRLFQSLSSLFIRSFTPKGSTQTSPRKRLTRRNKPRTFSTALPLAHSGVNARLIQWSENISLSK